MPRKANDNPILEQYFIAKELYLSKTTLEKIKNAKNVEEAKQIKLQALMNEQ